jgi:hypothetical protein
MRLVFATIGLVLVVGGLATAFQLYSQDLSVAAESRAEFADAYDTFQCLIDLTNDAVAESEVVYVTDSVDVGEVDWHQRMTELTARVRQVTGEESNADAILEVYRGPEAPCGGFGIRVTHS